MSNVELYHLTTYWHRYDIPKYQKNSGVILANLQFYDVCDCLIISPYIYITVEADGVPAG